MAICTVWSCVPVRNHAESTFCNGFSVSITQEFLALFRPVSSEHMGVVIAK
jgi:hypothetical protein